MNLSKTRSEEIENYTLVVFADDRHDRKDKDKTSGEPIQFYVGNVPPWSVRDRRSSPWAKPGDRLSRYCPKTAPPHRPQLQQLQSPRPKRFIRIFTHLYEARSRVLDNFTRHRASAFSPSG